MPCPRKLSQVVRSPLKPAGAFAADSTGSYSWRVVATAPSARVKSASQVPPRSAASAISLWNPSERR
eukprot:2302528-Alexandrium_andersonii.AAC.1